MQDGNVKMIPIAPFSPDASIGSSECAVRRLEEFNARLVESDSATQMLDEWCNSGEVNAYAQVRIKRVIVAPEPPTLEICSALKLRDVRMCCYRRVQLMRGDVILSEAENWYIPSELSLEMNVQLQQSDVPFGKIVRPLGFTRRTLNVEFLWRPAIRPGELIESPDVADSVLRHRALLLKPDSRPFSFVVETYTRHVLQYPQAAPPGCLAW